MLEGEYDLIIPDLRGFGVSDVMEADRSIIEYASDIAGLLERLRVRRAHIVGHSMGGYVALAFAREGARVVATDLKPDLLASLPKDVSTSTLDVLDDAAVQAFVERTGAVDILFNCAGYVHQGTILDCGIADWDFSFDLNVRSMFVMTKAMLP